MESTLSHQLLPIDHNFEVLRNLNKSISTNLPQQQQMLYELPCQISPLDYKLIPKYWDNITEQENTFLETLKLSEKTAYILEQETVTQSSCSAWYQLRKNRLISSKAHLVHKRKRNHESLANDLLNPKPEASLSSTVTQALNNRTLNELKARKCYTQII